MRLHSDAQILYDRSRRMNTVGKHRDSGKKTRKSAARAYETRVVPIDSIRPHPQNEKYHSHPDSQIATLAESVETFDQYRPIVVWNDLIVAGQGVWHGMKRAGETEIEIKDVSRLPEEVALSLMMTDNSLAKYSVTNEAEFAALVNQLAQTDEVLARLAAGEQKALEKLLGGTPSFQPVSVDEQGRLDEKKKVVCPNCGYEFTP